MLGGDSVLGKRRGERAQPGLRFVPAIARSSTPTPRQQEPQKSYGTNEHNQRGYRQ